MTAAGPRPVDRRPTGPVDRLVDRLWPDRPAVEARPGWALSLGALAVAALCTVLVVRWSVSIDWLAIRLAIGGLLTIGLAIGVGSPSLVGLAALPMLGGATIGLDRPVGHAWGQVLLIALLWYGASELAWTGIEARDGTRRSRDVDQLRIREVATVIAVAVGVGVAGSVLATAAPARTALLRAVAVAAVLLAVILLGRHLATRAGTNGGDGDDRSSDRAD